MNFLSRVARFLFWLVVVSWTVALAQKLVTWMLRDAAKDARGNANGPGADVRRSAGTAQSEPAARKLVRDPVCGMHVAEGLAVPLRKGAEILHFCSTACRDKYATNTRSMAAHG
jgi:YHS domain-containing protein